MSPSRGSGPDIRGTRPHVRGAQQSDFVPHTSRVCRHCRYPLDRGLDFGHVTVGPCRPAASPPEQQSHQRRTSAAAPADHIVDRGTHERYGVIAIFPPSPLTHC